MKHVVNFSGGLCSFWAAKRVIDKFGPEDVTLLFADVMIEDDDLYAFNKQAEEILGVKITRISKEMTPWELFRKKGMIGNSRFPLCSVILKREPLDDWRKNNCLEMDTVIYVGMDWTEMHRLKAIRKAEPYWNWEAPMTEEPIWDKCRMISEAEKLGIKIPRAYKLGFPHNNCGMRCVQAGISHWAHLLQVLPDKYKEWENEELATKSDQESRGIDSSHTILKTQKNGVKSALSLRDLRLQIESGERVTKEDWGGCGCGVQYDKAEIATPLLVG